MTCPRCKKPITGCSHLFAGETAWCLPCAEIRNGVRAGRRSPEDSINKMYAEMRSAIELRDKYRREGGSLLEEFRSQAHDEFRQRILLLPFWKRLKFLLSHL